MESAALRGRPPTGSPEPTTKTVARARTERKRQPTDPLRYRQLCAEGTPTSCGG